MELSYFNYFQKKFKNKLLIIFIIINCCNINLVFSNTNANQIANLEKQILNENNKLNDVEQDLKNIDQQISEKAQLLNKIQRKIIQTNNKKSKLEKDKINTDNNLKAQKEKLSKDLQAIYIINRNKNIQKLSNIIDIQQFNRFLNYLKIYNDHNIKSINDIKLSLKKIDKLNQDLNIVATQQKQNKKEIAKSYNELQQLKENNLAIKLRLQNSLNSNISDLDYYKSKRSKLNNILANNNIDRNVKSNINTLPDNIDLDNIFAQSKGKLPLPVSGIIDFNKTKSKSKNTIFIKTTEGKDVKAVFNGQVAFSNWLRGFGFLTIVDHGNGYMSLYGNNQTLLKKSGDFVEAGEVIALTGSSGGIATPGLYFEIRHNGNAINALAWLKTDLNKYIG